MADNHAGAAAGIGNGGTLVIEHSTLVDNRTTGGPFSSGGGISNGGTLTLTNSALAHNTAINVSGGGLYNSGGTATILNSTLVENSAHRAEAFVIHGGGGLVNNMGTVVLQNTLLALNTVQGTARGPDCFGPVTSLGNNFLGDPTECTITLQETDLTGEPGLEPYTDDGTPGNGHFPLLPASLAINAGNDAVCPKTDQLGEKRDKPCDIGAIEFHGEAMSSR